VLQFSFELKRLEAAEAKSLLENEEELLAKVHTSRKKLIVISSASIKLGLQ